MAHFKRRSRVPFMMRVFQRLRDAVLRRSRLAHDDPPAMALLAFPAWMPVAWRQRIACNEVRRDLYALGLPWHFSDAEILSGAVNLLPVFARRVEQLRLVFERLPIPAGLETT